MTNFAALKTANATRWANAKVTRRAEFVFAARRLVLAKARYQAVEAKTGVPWYFIAVAHEREASRRWDTHLGQGDPLNEVTRHVPKGEPAFSTWEEGAYDALVNCPPYAARNKDWSIGGLLTMLEQYNGLGYFNGPVTVKNGVVVARYPSQPSPYIWSGTDQYNKGKYVRDREFDPTKEDEQLGCAGLLMAMMALDRTISLDGKMPPIDTPDIHKPEPKPIDPPTNLWTLILSIIRAIFGRK
jgi:lysozyme family protein